MSSVVRRSRSRTPRAVTGLVRFVPLALAVACAGGSAATRDAPPGPPRRVVVFPLNVVVTLPTDVESGVAAVSEELRAYLEARGLAVDRVELADAREAWLRSAQALKAEVGPDRMSFEGAGRTLARQLREVKDFDALILPWIAMRSARMQGGTISWDGVKRKLKVAGSDGRPRSSWVLGRVRSTVVAPSLQLAVFSPQGEKLYEGIGGLDLVHDADLDVSSARIHFEMVPRTPIFQDRAYLRQGIAIAVDPLLPALSLEAD